MRDVAERAGVSTATVSRVLSGDGNGIRPETRERVLSAVEQLGYRPNRLPRYLRTMSVRTLAFIVGDIGNPFFTAIARGCEDAAAAQGYSLILSSTDESALREQACLQQMAAERVAGVILTSTGAATKAVRQLLAWGIPIVALDRRINGVAVDTVVVDNETAANAAVESLIQLGHTRIGIVAGPEGVSSTSERLAGYLRAIRSHGISVLPEFVRHGDLREARGYLLAHELLKLDVPPTAIFSVNNLTTIGVLRAIRERDLSIPEDVSLIGFDDIATAQLLQPPLTVVAQPTYQLGAKAAELLFRRINDPTAPVQEVMLAATLVVRGSVGTPVA